MARGKKNRKLRKYVELTERVNVIPEGVYELLRKDSEGVILALGDKIQIGVIGGSNKLVRPLSKQEGRERMMKTDAFLDQYYGLLEASKGNPTETSLPFTFCGIDPAIAREVH